MKIIKPVKKGSYPSFCKGFRFAPINCTLFALAKFTLLAGFPGMGSMAILPNH